MRARSIITVAMLASIGGAAGCSMKQQPARGDFRATDTAGKVPAIIDAAKRDDPATLAELIHALDDEDPAVRLFAGRSLTERTGRDFGYKYYDTPENRSAAARRWRQWLDQGPSAGGAATAETDTPAVR